MHRICFIDDSQDFEIPLFEEVFGRTYALVTGKDYREATSKMGADFQPDLFVLDLYFGWDAPAQDAIEALRSKLPEYEDDRADLRPAHRNYLRAEARLRAVLRAHRQGPDGGLELAEQAARDYPGVPIVFYSRKATFEDVVRCLAKDNVWAVEKKPTGTNDERTRELTRSAHDRLVETFNRAIAEADEAGIRQVRDAARVMLKFAVTTSG